MNRLTAGHVAGLIVVLLFALYPGVILGTHSFFFRDYGVFTYPVAYFAHESFWHGEVPLWNPLNNCGIPFLAQWNTSVCYPPSLIFMLFPLPWSLNYFLLGHLVLAGVGMYLLAYHWTQNRLAASVAGVAFALNGLMLNCLMWTSNLAALSWEPLVVLWVEQAWRIGGRRKIVIAALAGAMQMLSGAPEIIVFTWVILGAMWLVQVLNKKTSLMLTLRRLFALIVLIAGLSAIQLLPFFDLLKHSERDSAFTMSDGFPMPIWGWADFIVPVFHNFKFIFDVYLQPQQAWITSYYTGIGTLALAILAVWRMRQSPVRVLAAATLAGLILALGNSGFVYAWLKHIAPWIGFARYPIKFVSIPVFAIPLLAAYGLSSFGNGNSQRVKQSERPLCFSAAFLLFMVVIILAAARWLINPVFEWQAAWNDGGIRAIFLIATVVAVTATIRAKAERMRGLTAMTIPILIAFDLDMAGTHINPTVVTKAFGPLEFNMSFLPKYGQSRAMISEQAAMYLTFAGTTDPLYHYAGVRGALFENCNIPEHIPKTGGFCSLNLKEQWDVDGILSRAYVNENNTNPLASKPLLDFLGVSQISETNTIFAWHERNSYLPLITAGQQPVFSSALDTLKEMDSSDFDPRHVVYLPPETRDEITVTNNSSTAKIISPQFAAQRIQMNVETPSPTMVVIAQSFYHNWHAYIDGKPTRLWRANHAFQALQVPAGRHEVMLRYEDWMFRVGAMVSALTFFVCGIGFFWPKRFSESRP